MSEMTDTQLQLEAPAGPTPGPWNIGLPGGPAGPFWSLVNQRGEVVAMQITTEANARLIAAAPELLQLARLFERMLADLCDYDNSGGVLCAEAETDAMLDRVRAAIRQAEGKEQK